MAPVEIDGNPITGATIDGTDVQEITVDGDVVFSAGAAANIIDNFEDTPDGIYGPGDTLSTYYSGRLNHSRSTDSGAEGSKVIDHDISGPGIGFSFSKPGDGLNAYPQAGDEVAFLFRPTNSIAGGLGVGLQDEDNGYLYSYSDGTQNMRIWEINGGSASVLQGQSLTLTSDEWYWGQGTVPISNSNLVWEIYNANTGNTPPTRGSFIQSISVTDSTFSGAGIGPGVVGTSTTNGGVLDFIHIV